MSLCRPCTRRLPIRASQRTFSTTTSRPVSLQIDRNHAETVADTVPAYPHGPARWYKQSNKGLYGGQRIQFGNNVSGDFNTKTRRTFQVNVLTKRLWSHALNRFIQVRVTARTLRTIDRVGGLDEYLLGDNASRIKQLGVSGWWLRWAIMQQPSIKERFRKERYDLGLGPKDDYESKLKQLEAGNVGADLEEAYAALPEEGEAEAAAAAAEAAESGEMPEMSEEHTLISMDGPGSSKASPPSEFVFNVTNPPDLPPLKFRVDRRTHVVLTPKGWIRTKPERSEYTKKWIASHKFGGYVESRMEKFAAELARMRLEEMPEMTVMEEREVLNDAKRRFTRELEEGVDAVFEEERMGVVEKRSNRARNRALHEAKVKRDADGEVQRETDALDAAAQAQAA